MLHDLLKRIFFTLTFQIDKYVLTSRSSFCSYARTAPPTFITRPQDQKVGLNGVATFECVAEGNPPPSVFWTKEGSQVLMFPGTAYGHFHITPNGALRVQGVQKEDAGYLVCSALSVAGSATVRALLQVRKIEERVIRTRWVFVHMEV